MPVRRECGEEGVVTGGAGSELGGGWDQGLGERMRPDPGWEAGAWGAPGRALEGTGGLERRERVGSASRAGGGGGGGAVPGGAQEAGSRQLRVSLCCCWGSS